MPFEPGHKINGNPSGLPKDYRKRLASLALELRENVDFPALRDRLVRIANGQDPATGCVVDAKTQMRAIEILYDRAYGGVVQHVVLEGELRQEIVDATPAPVRQTMTLEEINRRRALLRAALAPAIDAASSEAEGDE